MTKKLLSPGEVIVVRENIKSIERCLGHAIPRGLIDYNDLNSILSPREVAIISQNIRDIERKEIRRNHSFLDSSDPIGTIIFLLVFVGILIGVIN